MYWLPFCYICNTKKFILLFARFCYVFLCELRGPAWALGSYTRNPPAEGIP